MNRVDQAGFLDLVKISPAAATTAPMTPPRFVYSRKCPCPLGPNIFLVNHDASPLPCQSGCTPKNKTAQVPLENGLFYVSLLFIA
jgi:hypothetical protein